MHPRWVFWLFAAMLFAGWDFSRHSVPLDQIKHGGPAKDGIPALLKPKFVSPPKAGFLKKRDRVIGLEIQGEARAYPVKILNWHEIVNDRVGGRAVVVTFCPLCGTGMVFDAASAGKERSFGVSGLLYQSDMLLYDHQSESLWSQIKSEAVAGPMTGTRLKLLPSTHTTWADWLGKHPATRVLSTDTGHRRDYERDPYGDYARSAALFFPVKAENRRYHPKERVVGVTLGGQAKAYPFSELARAPSPVWDEVGGRRIRVVYDARHRTASVMDPEGAELPAVTGFWFAWYAFHPDTGVFTTPPARGE